MTAVSQNFTIYAGDSSLPAFTVVDGAGTAIDISSVSQILWQVARDGSWTPIAVEKNKAGPPGGISFVTDGTNGKFQVALGPNDTGSLTGYYLHRAIITDQFGNVSTVTLGRLQVGVQPVWTYSGDPSLSDRDAVRFAISDTDATRPLLYDPEIDFLLTKFPSWQFAAAQAARQLVGKFAKFTTSKTVGDLSISYSDMVKNYTALAKELQMQAEMSGVTLYSGGTSKSDMAAVAANSDRVPQPFSRAQFDITPQSQGPAFPPDAVEDL